MSNSGLPQLKVSASGAKVLIVASQWHEKIMGGLIDGAIRACEENGVEYRLMRVPGSFELPVAIAKFISEYDAAVALGVVIRGGTPHFDYVCQGVTQGVMEISISTAKPIGFGVLTCDTEEQALDRAGFADSFEDKGYDATMAALAVATL